MLSAKAFRAGMLGVLEEQGGVAANVTQEGTERGVQHEDDVGLLMTTTSYQ